MRQLTDDEVVDVLEGNGVGVLALTDWREPHPHPLPLAYGYDADGDSLVVQLEGDAESHKKQCLERSRDVGFTVYEETVSNAAWRSVVVKGELVEISYQDAEPAFANLAQTTQTAPNPVVWGDADTVTPHELAIDSWSGREFRIG